MTISIQNYSFSFLLKSKIKNINFFWDAKNKNLHFNISSICKPDKISLEIIETYLKSELIPDEILEKISCLLNNLTFNNKIITLKHIFQNAKLDETIDTGIGNNKVKEEVSRTQFFGVIYRKFPKYVTDSDGDLLIVEGTVADIISGGFTIMITLHY